MAEQEQQPEDARPAREQLWRRLLDGQVTEVYVTGFEHRVNRYLAQTLGLVPIYSGPNRRNRGGNLAWVASRLAAEPRRIAGGGPWEVRERFRDKTFVIVDPKDRRRLRATRAAAPND